MKDANVRRCELAVDALLPFQDMKAEILKVCRAVIYEWKDVDDAKFEAYRINGGITNIMVKVSNQNQAVVVRVFGPATEGVLDREREIQANYYLSLAGFCPELKGIFKNGLIQAFVKARTLQPEDFCDNEVVSNVAKELRRLHKLEIPGERKPIVWTEMARYIELASSVTFKSLEDQRKLDMISFDELRQEADTLKKLGLLIEGPIVYSHNDLLPANIMVDEQGKYYMIDFEYSGYNYRGFDIGNHFNEYTGFECDFSVYPNKEKQFRFLRHYLHPEDPDMATNDELEGLYVEANFYALTAHLQWLGWTIIQATSSSTMEFDYMSYYSRRMDLFRKQKTEFLPLVQSYIARREAFVR